MIKRSDIVAIVVLYNPNKTIIENVKKYNKLLDKTVVVDNSSRSNTKYFSNLEHIEYVALKCNRGISYALNVGIKRTKEKYIITMDQDSIISDTMIKGYLKFLRNFDSKDIGALTPVYDTDRHPEKASTGFKEVTLSMQSGTLFKRSTFDKIGYFNDRLFLDVVDYEFFLRMKQSNLHLVRVNSVILHHHPAKTYKIKIGNLCLKYGKASPLRYYYQARNLLWTAKRYKNLKLYFIILVKWLKIILLFNNKKAYLQNFCQGLKDARNNVLGKRT